MVRSTDFCGGSITSHASAVSERMSTALIHFRGPPRSHARVAGGARTWMYGYKRPRPSLAVWRASRLLRKANQWPCRDSGRSERVREETQTLGGEVACLRSRIP